MGDLRYADAGVDIDAGNRAVDLIRRAVASTHTPSVLGGIGAFSGLFELDVTRWKQPVLVSSTDSVGTKVKVAIATNRHRGIGVDLVNHCVNDVLCCGAEPLFFLDYYATGKLAPEHLAEVIDGVAAACRDNGCALVGGETAEMPGVYALGDYDIAGFIVGAVERAAIIDGSRVEAGDVLLALPSSGLHTNGYSLVRHVVLTREMDWNATLPGTDGPLADLLLEPHRTYLHAVRDLRTRLDVRAIAHITGGGLIENVPRVLPAHLCAVIDRSSWTVPPLFTAVEHAGGVMAEEMWRTFNMGVGMVLAVPRQQADAVSSAAGLTVWRIGEVVEASGGGARAPGMSGRSRVGVLVSGGGSNLAALLDACAAPSFPAEVVLVVSNRRECGAVDIARTRGVRTLTLPVGDFGNDASARDRAMLDELRAESVELVVCAGYNRVLSDEVLAAYPEAILNVHPSLLPAFGGGMNAVGDALAAGVKVTGCTVHLLAIGAVDGGPIVLQAPVTVEEEDDVTTLLARIHEQEWRLLPRAVELWATRRLRVDGNTVHVAPAAALGAVAR